MFSGCIEKISWEIKFYPDFWTKIKYFTTRIEGVNEKLRYNKSLTETA